MMEIEADTIYEKLIISLSSPLEDQEGIKRIKIVLLLPQGFPHFSEPSRSFPSTPPDGFEPTLTEHHAFHA